jgi:hypothetical protein
VSCFVLEMSTRLDTLRNAARLKARITNWEALAKDHDRAGLGWTISTTSHNAEQCLEKAMTIQKSRMICKERQPRASRGNQYGLYSAIKGSASLFNSASRCSPPRMEFTNKVSCHRCEHVHHRRPFSARNCQQQIKRQKTRKHKDRRTDEQCPPGFLSQTRHLAHDRSVSAADPESRLLRDDCSPIVIKI